MKFGLTFRSNDKVLLSSFMEKLKNTWLELYPDQLSIIGLPTKKHKYDVLRSPHVDKKSRDKWEIRTHSYYCVITNKNEREMQLILDYILKYIPGGIGVVFHRYQFLNF